jgi:predicted secreted Zn-dependent protease
MYVPNRAFITLLLFFFSGMLHLAWAQTDVISWAKNVKLTWKDFKGKPNMKVSEVAVTNTRIDVQFGFRNNAFTHTISCTFNKQKSWTKTSDSLVLQHEQLHFDIAEKYARLLHKKINEFNFKGTGSEKKLQEIYQITMQQFSDEQQRYDSETDHSKNILQQTEWKRKMAQDIDNLEPFATYK